MVFTAYLHSLETKINEDTMLQMFQRLYKRVSFRALDKLERPFIFAYSALVNDDVQKKTKECGFDDCIASKLGPDEL